ncbi:MAG: hypothetical protein EOP47_11030 [Sphingobacteriaceae bacterium]|nr:MAG: hypothetical protein EOP47_11030 [Sphingobacteriaceae bacterium]
MTILLAFFLFGLHSFAQQTVRGTVGDMLLQSSLSGATVTMNEHSTLTDDKGQFRFTNILPGNYSIMVTYSGYQQQQVEIKVISGKENAISPDDAKFRTPNIPVAVLLEGKFSSLYANRVSAAMRDSISAYGGSFMPQNIDDNKMIVVADGDIVLNSVSKGNEPLPMGVNPYTIGTQREVLFANAIFLQNCLDYLVNENNLSEAKAKDYVARLLNMQKVKEEKTFWQIINIAVPVLLVILFAVIFQWNRKRKYSK